MKVVVSAAAEHDADAENAWWRENRPDAPDRFGEEVTAALARLAIDAATMPVFRRVGSMVVRRLYLPVTRRHVYFVVDEGRVTVLAVWGSVRRVLPALRRRAGAVRTSDS